MSLENKNDSPILGLIRNSNNTVDALAQTPPEVAYSFYFNKHETKPNAKEEVKMVIAALRNAPHILNQMTPRELEHGLNTIEALVENKANNQLNAVNKTIFHFSNILDTAFSANVSGALKEQVSLSLQHTPLSHTIQKLRQSTEPTASAPTHQKP